MTQARPANCPSCGGSSCSAVTRRHPLLLELAALGVVLILTVGGVVALESFLSFQTAMSFGVLILLLGIGGVGALWRTRFQSTYECPTCGAKFRYERIV